jgi:outer membrane protein OmpA-like peptidoglycan-associated protein
MTRDELRAHRFANAWLGTALATFVGIGSTVELAAMPIPAPGAQLPGPILIQQSPKPQEKVQPPGVTPPTSSAGEGEPDSFTELRESLTAAEERLKGLSRVAKALAATKQLQQELAALQKENQELRAELYTVQTERGELETAKQAAEAHAAELTETAQQATAKARETDQELVAVRSQSEQRIAAADSARTEAEARLSEERDILRGVEQDLRRAEQEKARVGADLARVQAELATAKKEVAAARQQHAQSDQRAAALEKERNDLRTRLGDATERLRWSEAVEAHLQSEVIELTEAAATAAAAARQNRTAVENRMKELNQVLAAISPAAGPLEADPALLAESGTPSRGAQADSEGRAAAAPVGNVAAVAAPSLRPESGSADADPQQTETAGATRRGEVEGAHLDERGILGGVPAVLTLADLPLEKRQHMQGLLTNLQSKLDARGLMTTVPGEVLFSAGSNEVQEGAYDTLAKVAELIDMYGSRQVLIIGHSDAVGDAERNRYLSELRAERVKQIFVDYFELAPDRLSTAGLGEARPIASNATPQGRSANRRVEVLILN